MRYVNALMNGFAAGWLNRETEQQHVYNLSVGLTPASSPGRGAIGKEAKFAQCQSLSYQERCHRR